MHTRLRTRNCNNEEKFLPDVLKEACRVARKVICFETEDNSSLNSEYIISGRHLDRLGGWPALTGKNSWISSRNSRKRRNYQTGIGWSKCIFDHIVIFIVTWCKEWLERRLAIKRFCPELSGSSMQLNNWLFLRRSNKLLYSKAISYNAVY
jgi:hypothetical protein